MEFISESLQNSCSLLEMKHPMEAHSKYAYFTFVSDRDKGLIQALQVNFPNNHSTQCIIHIQRNVTTKFKGSAIQSDVYKIAKTFSLYQENKMLNKIKNNSQAAYDYLVGPEGIEASKWRSTEWLRKRHLPPRYGIISSNISESSNSLYEDARKLPWLYCIDNILTTMSTRISMLREKNRDKVGVVPEVVGIIQNRWDESEKHTIIQLEEGGDTYRITRHEINSYQTIHVVHIKHRTCTCGMWQEYGYPCIDGMVYYRQIEEKTLEEILESDLVSEFYNYGNYHELMKRNIHPVVMEILEATDELKCLPPVAVKRQAGSPRIKRLRLGRSWFNKPEEESSIICSICNARGHNKRTCHLRKTIKLKVSTKGESENNENPPADLS
jgi:SWIM zinc finger/Transposase, Mutator family